MLRHVSMQRMGDHWRLISSMKQGFVVSKAELEMPLDEFKGTYCKGGLVE